MTTGVYEQIRSNEKYPLMVARRRRLATALVSVVLGVFFAFILVVAFAPALLARPMADGGVTTVAIPLGIAMMLVFWLLTGLYVILAKRDFDQIRNQILKEVTP